MNAPSPDLWRRIEPILERALELEPEARMRYLEESCAGNAELHQEVENLLAADRLAMDFLSGPVGEVFVSVFQEIEPAPAKPPAELVAGRELGPYQIVRRLGGGGMGMVYEAEDPQLGRRVALKLLPSEMAADAGRLARFEREARALAALNHPNIVTIHSMEQARGVPFLTMELVKGRTLDALIPASGMALETFLDLAVSLADALADAHHKGITHRDLKPANIIVTGGGRLKILDFGLAKLHSRAPVADASEAETMSITRDGLVLGTVPYMSPEQAEGKPVDPRTDIFSLGIILYEMITGERPFHGDTPAALISSILKDVPRSVHDIRPDLPVPLEEILQSCLGKTPEQRPSTALQLRDRLDWMRHKSEASGILPSAGAAVPQAAQRRDRLMATAAAAVLALVTALDAVL